jgi:transposase
MSIASIAREVGCTENTVRTWKRRFAQERMGGLKDKTRPGRPPIYSPIVVTCVKAIACELPWKCGLPLSRLSLKEIADQVKREIQPAPSRSTIQRWLKLDALRPWFHRSWIFPRDKDFFAKASSVLELYHGRWQGKPLGPKDVVLCADEKTAIQALERCHPLTPPSPGRVVRVEHEYKRKGVISYVAVLNVRTGQVLGHCPTKNGKLEFRKFVTRIMEKEQYRSAKRVFLIIDNGPAHNPSTFPEWLKEIYPRVVAVHLPKHGSWLNQIEIYFSILQRKALTPMDVLDVDALAHRILSFEKRYNKMAKPFSWKFTFEDLRRVLDRFPQH